MTKEEVIARIRELAIIPAVRPNHLPPGLAVPKIPLVVLDVQEVVSKWLPIMPNNED
jgi:hypothetical protein